VGVQRQYCGQLGTADEAFGGDTRLLDTVADLGLWYFAEVPHDTWVWPTIEASTPLTIQAMRAAVRADAWERHTFAVWMDFQTLAVVLIYIMRCMNLTCVSTG
jgi:SRSO17 transposase